MKVPAFTALFCLLASIVVAQLFPMRPAKALEHTGVHTGTANNSEIVFWAGNDEGDLDIYAQKFNHQGETLWQQPIALVSGLGIQKPLGAVKTSDNNIIFWWIDYVDVQFANLKAQKITSNGQKLWGSEGILLMGMAYGFEDTKALADDNGGAYIVWGMGYWPRLFYQHLDSWGNPLVDDGGLCILEDESYQGESYHLDQIFHDTEGGLMLKYYMEADQIRSYNLFRITASGNKTGDFPLIPAGFWDGEGFEIIQTADAQYILCQAAHQPTQHLRFERIDADGQPLSQGSFVYPLPDGENARNLQLIAYSDGAFTAVWQSSSTNAVQWRAQHFDADYAELWQAPGVIVTSGSDMDSMPNLTITDDQTLWLVWDAYAMDFEQTHVRVQGIKQTGTVVWDQGGKILSDGAGKPNLTAMAERCFLFWENQNDGYKSLKRQLIDCEGQNYVYPTQEAFAMELYGVASQSKCVCIGTRFLTMWNDTRMGQSQIYYQFSDSSSNAILTRYGKALYADGTQNTYLHELLTLDDNRAVILFYEEYGSYRRKYYLQMMDSQGNTYYPGKGYDITAHYFVSDMAIEVRDQEISLLWSRYVEISHQLFAQRIVDGELMWGSSGKQIYKFNVNNYPLGLMVRGRYFIWDDVNMHLDQIRSKALLLDADGYVHPNWFAGGVSIILGPNTEPNFIRDATVVDGDLVAIVGYYNYQTQVSQHRVQRLSSTMERLWMPVGRPILQYLESRYHYDFVFYEDDFICVTGGFEDYEYTFRMQKFDYDGKRLWGTDGVRVASYNYQLDKAKVAKFADGSYACVFSTSTGSAFDDRDVFIRHFSEAGAALSQTQTLCAAPYTQELESIAVQDNQLLVNWCDERAGITQDYKAICGIWSCRINSFFTHNEDPVHSPAASLSLKGNQPNPFRRSTRICFELKNQQSLSIDIYNIKGQKLRRLAVNQPFAKGVHLIDWDGKDERGRAQSSGIYLCRISCGNMQQSIKMILSK